MTDEGDDMTMLPDREDLIDRILHVLEDGGWHDEEECDGPDDVVREVATLVWKAADWKAQMDHLERLSMKMADRLDKLNLDAASLRDENRSLKAKLAKT